MPPLRGEIHREHGPLIEVVIRIDHTVAGQYAASGRPIPEPVRGWALIDTGAGQSGIDESVAIGLGLNPVGVAQIQTPTGQPLKVGVFWGELGFPGLDLKPMRQPFLGMHLNYAVTEPEEGDPRRMIAILGRDFLRGMMFRYDGQRAQYILERPTRDDAGMRILVTYPSQI